jgi:hypothetical protein
MSVRAYMLLDIVDRNCECAVELLRSRAEVILADRLDGYPNIIAMVEAANKKSLAEAIMPVLVCIDGITEYMNLLVTQDNEIPFDLLAPSNSTQHKMRRRKRRGSEKRIKATTNSERR